MKTTSIRFVKHGLRVVFLTLAGALCVLLVESEGAGAQTRRDSAGGSIFIYETRHGPNRRWVIEPKPLFEVGGENATGASQFSMIAGVVRLPDDSYAVADADSREIRVLDGRGQHLNTFAGRGSGPGELTSLWRIWRGPGVLLAVDGQGRVHKYSRNGEYLETITPPVAAPGRRLRSYGYLSDGGLIASFIEGSGAPAHGRSTRYMNLVKLQGSTIRKVGRFPAYEAVHRPNGAEASVIYGPTSHVAVLTSEFCVAYSVDYVIRCFDAGGTFRAQVVRRQWRTESVTAADRNVFFAGIDLANPGPRGADYRAEMRNTTIFAERFPPFGRLVSSANDELWVGPLVAADETLGVLNPSPPVATEWSVYTTGGAWLASITLPARFRLMDAGLDYVAGVSRDAHDVERVIVYRLRRTP
jgi:hypothetical protein